MKAKSRRKLWSLLFIAIAAVSLTLYLTRHQPIARFALPDGTELRLEYVTYGTEHRVPGANRFVAWAAEVAQRWPKLGIPIYQAEYRRSFDEPQLVLWFTQLDPKQGKLVLGSIDELQVVAAEGYSGFVPSMLLSNHLDFQEQVMPMPHAAFSGLTYDRRKPELPLRLTVQGQSFLVTIPNPAAKTPYPTWPPEPLPQSRRVGELEVVLRSIEAFDEYDPIPSFHMPKVTKAYEVRHDGKEGKGIVFFDDTPDEITDATGNGKGRLGSVPCFSESAWKIRKAFYRTADFPFSAADGSLLGPVPMPDAGNYVILRPFHEHTRLPFVVLLGPGHYLWRDGAFVKTGEPLSQDALAMLAGQLRENAFLINVEEPRLVFVYRTSDDAVSPEEQQRIVRGLWDGKAHGLTIRATIDFHRGASLFAVDSCDLSEDYTPPNIPGPVKPFHRPPPTPGTPLTIQDVWLPSVEYVEFLVAPPKPKQRLQPSP